MRLPRRSPELNGIRPEETLEGESAQTLEEMQEALRRYRERRAESQEIARVALSATAPLRPFGKPRSTVVKMPRLKPDASNPDASNPDASKPGAAKPSASRPNASKPSLSKPNPLSPTCPGPNSRPSGRPQGPGGAAAQPVPVPGRSVSGSASAEV